jgi:hypothetical protein
MKIKKSFLRLWIFVLLTISISACGAIFKRNDKTKSDETTDNQKSAQSRVVKIYHANELINIGKKQGLDALKDKIDPLCLVVLDTAYASTLIDLEFENGLWSTHPYNKNIKVCHVPETTRELAELLNNQKAVRKLYNYYCSIPKFNRSDTLYHVLNNLDEFLSVLLKNESPLLINRLKRDFVEWEALARTSPKKKYLSKEELKAPSFKDSQKFNPNELIVDCNYIAFQIAAALNSRNIVGFDDALMQKLKAKQSNPYLERYSFPKPEAGCFNVENTYISRKVLSIPPPALTISKDYKKIEKIILDSINNCCQSSLYEVIENGDAGYFLFSRNNGMDGYRVSIQDNNILVIDLMESGID